MFDISFGELLVVGTVALVVIGPERLPKVARTVGAMVGRLQRYVANVKADIKREVELNGLLEAGAEVQEAARKMGDELRSGLDPVKAGVSGLADEAVAAVQPDPASPAKADDKQFDLFAPATPPRARPERDQR